MQCLYCKKKLGLFASKKRPFCSEVHEVAYTDEQAGVAMRRVMDPLFTVPVEKAPLQPSPRSSGPPGGTRQAATPDPASPGIQALAAGRATPPLPVTPAASVSPTPGAPPVDPAEETVLQPMAIPPPHEGFIRERPAPHPPDPVPAAAPFEFEPAVLEALLPEGSGSGLAGDLGEGSPAEHGEAVEVLEEDRPPVSYLLHPALEQEKLDSIPFPMDGEALPVTESIAVPVSFGTKISKKLPQLAPELSTARQPAASSGREPRLAEGWLQTAVLDPQPVDEPSGGWRNVGGADVVEPAAMEVRIEKPDAGPALAAHGLYPALLEAEKMDLIPHSMGDGALPAAGSLAVPLNFDTEAAQMLRLALALNTGGQPAERPDREPPQAAGWLPTAALDPRPVDQPFGPARNLAGAEVVEPAAMEVRIDRLDAGPTLATHGPQPALEPESVDLTPHSMGAEALPAAASLAVPLSFVTEVAGRLRLALALRTAGHPAAGPEREPQLPRIVFHPAVIDPVWAAVEWRAAGGAQLGSGHQPCPDSHREHNLPEVPKPAVSTTRCLVGLGFARAWASFNGPHFSPQGAAPGAPRGNALPELREAPCEPGIPSLRCAWNPRIAPATLQAIWPVAATRAVAESPVILAAAVEMQAWVPEVTLPVERQSLAFQRLGWSGAAGFTWPATGPVTASQAVQAAAAEIQTWVPEVTLPTGRQALAPQRLGWSGAAGFIWPLNGPVVESPAVQAAAAEIQTWVRELTLPMGRQSFASQRLGSSGAAGFTWTAATTGLVVESPAVQAAAAEIRTLVPEVTLPAGRQSFASKRLVSSGAAGFTWPTAATCPTVEAAAADIQTLVPEVTLPTGRQSPAHPLNAGRLGSSGAARFNWPAARPHGETAAMEGAKTLLEAGDPRLPSRLEAASTRCLAGLGLARGRAFFDAGGAAPPAARWNVYSALREAPAALRIPPSTPQLNFRMVTGALHGIDLAAVHGPAAQAAVEGLRSGAAEIALPVGGPSLTSRRMDSTGTEGLNWPAERSNSETFAMEEARTLLEVRNPRLPARQEPIVSKATPLPFRWDLQRDRRQRYRPSSLIAGLAAFRRVRAASYIQIREPQLRRPGANDLPSGTAQLPWRGAGMRREVRPAGSAVPLRPAVQPPKWAA